MKNFYFILALGIATSLVSCSKKKDNTTPSTNSGSNPTLPSTFGYYYATGTFHFVCNTDLIDVTLNAAPDTTNQIAKYTDPVVVNLISLVSEDQANPGLSGNPDLIFVLANQENSFYPLNQSIHINTAGGDSFEYKSVVNGISGKYRPIDANVIFSQLNENQVAGTITGTFDFDNDGNARSCTITFTINK